MLNHVLLHQTVIGQEALAQMAMTGEEPDVVVACVGGGSNFGGLTFPFLRRVMRGDARPRARIASKPNWVEAASPGMGPVPTLAMPTPAEAMRSPSARREAWAVLRMLHRAVNG